MGKSKCDYYEQISQQEIALFEQLQTAKPFDMDNHIGIISTPLFIYINFVNTISDLFDYCKTK